MLSFTSEMHTSKQVRFHTNLVETKLKSHTRIVEFKYAVYPMYPKERRIQACAIILDHYKISFIKHFVEI